MQNFSAQSREASARWDFYQVSIIDASRKSKDGILTPSIRMDRENKINKQNKKHKPQDKLTNFRDLCLIWKKQNFPVEFHQSARCLARSSFSLRAWKTENKKERNQSLLQDKQKDQLNTKITKRDLNPTSFPYSLPEHPKTTKIFRTVGMISLSKEPKLLKSTHMDDESKREEHTVAHGRAKGGRTSASSPPAMRPGAQWWRSDGGARLKRRSSSQRSRS